MDGLFGGQISFRASLEFSFLFVFDLSLAFHKILFDLVLLVIEIKTPAAPEVRFDFEFGLEVVVDPLLWIASISPFADRVNQATSGSESPALVCDNSSWTSMRHGSPFHA